MAKKNTKKVSKIKIKKKTWYKIQAPKSYGSKHIGETYLANAQSAIGRVMTINLKDLTDSFRDQSMHITLRLESIKDQQFTTSVIGFKVVPSFIKRMTRKRTSRLDSVFTVTTKDGKNVLIKSLAIALFNSNKSVGTALRAKMQDIIKETAQKLNFEAFANEITSGKIRMVLKKQLKTVYPVKEAIVRQFKVVSATKAKIEVVETKESHEAAEEASKETVEEVPLQEEITEQKEEDQVDTTQEEAKDQPVEKQEE